MKHLGTIMKQDTLKEVILSQSIRPVKNEVSREIDQELERYAKLPHAVLISGIRRSGKSTLLEQLINKRHAKCYYLNFEDERLINFKTEDFDALHEIFIELYGDNLPFFLDEIQNIENWEVFVRRLYKQGYKFYITGSNASMLSHEMGTKLTGRHVDLELFPFSFKEYLQFQKVNYDQNDLYLTPQRALLKKHFNLYLKEGGMPEFLQYKDSIVLQRTYDDILYRDIITRYDVKAIKQFRSLSFYLMSNISSKFTYNNLKNLFGFGSVSTVKNYIDYLTNSYLLFPLTRFAFSLKSQEQAPRKIYAIDNGMVEKIAFKFSQKQGQYLENLVYLELRRRHKELYYYETKNDLEVDFLVYEAGKIQALIQVSYDISVEQTKTREINALVKAMKETGCETALLLTYDTKDILTIENKTIQILPVYHWILTK